jgi:hypothetical protein
MMTRTVSVIVREDDPSWWAWSPQCPGLTAGHETEAELLQSLPGTIAWYFEDDHSDYDFDIQIHVEREVGGVFIRVAHDEQYAARQEVADRIAAALANPVLAERLRGAPANWAGEVVFICALPTDTRAWLDHQTEEGDGAVIVFVPLSGTTLWARAFGDQPADVPVSPGLPVNAGDPVRPATFGEVTRTPDRQRILVPA